MLDKGLPQQSRGREFADVQGSRAEKIVPPYTFAARAYAAAMNPATPRQGSHDGLSSSRIVRAPIRSGEKHGGAFGCLTHLGQRVPAVDAGRFPQTAKNAPTSAAFPVRVAATAAAVLLAVAAFSSEGVR